MVSVAEDDDKHAVQNDHCTAERLGERCRVGEVIGILVGAIPVVTAAVVWLRRRYKRTLGLKKGSIKLLSQLTANLPTDHFTRVLGPPRHARHLDHVDEFSYVHKYFQVQAIADKTEACSAMPSPLRIQRSIRQFGPASAFPRQCPPSSRSR
jgi:hypothetical protein